MWSLGVMAFELLVGQPALRMHEGKDKGYMCVYTPVESASEGRIENACTRETVLENQSEAKIIPISQTSNFKFSLLLPHDKSLLTH